MSGSASHRRTPSELASEQAALSTVQEPDSPGGRREGGGDFVVLEKHALETEASEGCINATAPDTKASPTTTATPPSQPPTEEAKAMSAAEAGKLAAIQRERVQEPAKALAGVVGGKKGGVVPAKPTTPPAKQTWFGWGKPRSPSTEFQAVTDDAESDLDTERAQVEAAIERNQAEQEALRKQLNAKQTELLSLLEKHSDIIRKGAEAPVTAPVTAPVDPEGAAPAADADAVLLH